MLTENCKKFIDDFHKKFSPKIKWHWKDYYEACLKEAPDDLQFLEQLISEIRNNCSFMPKPAEMRKFVLIILNEGCWKNQNTQKSVGKLMEDRAKNDQCIYCGGSVDKNSNQYHCNKCQHIK